MGSSYRSWSSRGITATSDQYEQKLLEQSQAMDVEGLSNSWQSNFQSQVYEQNSGARYELSHVSIQDVQPHNNGIEGAVQFTLTSTAVQSGWLADDMGSSYRSWSSRGIAASDRHEPQIHEQSKAMDVDGLSKVSSSQHSWQSDSPSQVHEQNSDARSKLSHEFIHDGVHRHILGDGISVVKLASSAQGIAGDSVGLDRSITNVQSQIQRRRFRHILISPHFPIVEVFETRVMEEQACILLAGLGQALTVELIVQVSQLWLQPPSNLDG